MGSVPAIQTDPSKGLRDTPWVTSRLQLILWPEVEKRHNITEEQQRKEHYSQSRAGNASPEVRVGTVVFLPRYHHIVSSGVQPCGQLLLTAANSAHSIFTYRISYRILLGGDWGGGRSSVAHHVKLWITKLASHRRVPELPTDATRMVTEDSPSPSAFAIHVGNLDGVSGSGFSMVQTWPMQPVGKRTRRWKTCLCMCMRVCVSLYR